MVKKAAWWCKRQSSGTKDSLALQKKSYDAKGGLQAKKTVWRYIILLAQKAVWRLESYPGGAKGSLAVQTSAWGRKWKLGVATGSLAV